MSANLEATRQAMNHFITNKVAEAVPRLFSDIFENLMWLQDDNGGAINAVFREWLDGDDIFKIRAALEVQDVFLFYTRKEMAQKFEELSSRWPEIKVRCEEILRLWDSEDSQ